MDIWMNMGLDVTKIIVDNYWWFASGIFVICIILFSAFYSPVDNDLENTVLAPALTPLVLGITGPFFIIIFIFLFPFLLIAFGIALASWLIYHHFKRWRQE